MKCNRCGTELNQNEYDEICDDCWNPNEVL